MMLYFKLTCQSLHRYTDHSLMLACFCVTYIAKISWKATSDMMVAKIPKSPGWFRSFSSVVHAALLSHDPEPGTLTCHPTCPFCRVKERVCMCVCVYQSDTADLAASVRLSLGFLY